MAGREFHAIPVGELADWVRQVVRVEFPVHVEDVKGRICTTGGKRLGSRISQALDRAIDLAVSQGLIRRGDFLWASIGETPVRDRSNLPAAMRSLDRICDDEIKLAILLKLRAGFGLEAVEIPSTVCRALGFAKTSEDAAARISSLLATLNSDGQLQFKSGSIVTAIAHKDADK